MQRKYLNGVIFFGIFQRGVAALFIAFVGGVFTWLANQATKNEEALKREQQKQQEVRQHRKQLQNDILALEELLTSEETLTDLVQLRHFNKGDGGTVTDDLLVKTISLMYKAIRLRVVLDGINKQNQAGFEEQFKLLNHRMLAFKASLFDVAYKLRNELLDIDEEVMNQFFEVSNAMVFFAAIDNNFKNGRASFEVNPDATQLTLSIGNETVGEEKTKVNVVHNTVKWYLKHAQPTFVKLEQVFNLRDTRDSYFKDTNIGNVDYDMYGNLADIKQASAEINNVILKTATISELGLESVYKLGRTRTILKTEDGVSFQTTSDVGSKGEYQLGSFENFIKFMILKLDAKIEIKQLT